MRLDTTPDATLPLRTGPVRTGGRGEGEAPDRHLGLLPLPGR